MRWAGSGGGPAVFALTEAGGPLTDLGALTGSDPERRCRAEIRVDTPAGPWTVRLASLISDAPAGLLWDTEGLLLVKYGFHVYALRGADGRRCAGPTGPRRRSSSSWGRRGCPT